MWYGSRGSHRKLPRRAMNDGRSVRLERVSSPARLAKKMDDEMEKVISTISELASALGLTAKHNPRGIDHTLMSGEE